MLLISNGPLLHLNSSRVSLFLTVTPVIFEDIALLSGLPKQSPFPEYRLSVNWTQTSLEITPV